MTRFIHMQSSFGTPPFFDPDHVTCVSLFLNTRRTKNDIPRSTIHLTGGQKFVVDGEPAKVVREIEQLTERRDCYDDTQD